MLSFSGFSQKSCVVFVLRRTSKQTKKMKKIILPVFALAACISSCGGPNAEEIEKRAQLQKDSIEAVENQMKEAMDARMKSMQDSLDAAKAAADAMQKEMKEEMKEVKNQIEKNSDASKKEIDRIKKEKKKQDDQKKPENVKAGEGKG